MISPETFQKRERLLRYCKYTRIQTFPELLTFPNDEISSPAGLEPSETTYDLSFTLPQIWLRPTGRSWQKTWLGNAWTRSQWSFHELVYETYRVRIRLPFHSVPKVSLMGQDNLVIKLPHARFTSFDRISATLVWNYVFRQHSWHISYYNTRGLHSIIIIPPKTLYLIWEIQWLRVVEI